MVQDNKKTTEINVEEKRFGLVFDSTLDTLFSSEKIFKNFKIKRKGKKESLPKKPIKPKIPPKPKIINQRFQKSFQRQKVLRRF